MENTIITLGTTVEDRFGNSHTFYSAKLKDADKLRELLPKVDMNYTIANVLNIDESGEFNEDAYEALLELVKLSLRNTEENIEEWLDARSAKIAIRTLLGLPVWTNM